MDSNCQSHLKVLLPFEPLLGQLTKPVKQLRPILAPAPLVDQHEEGALASHLLLNLLLFHLLQPGAPLLSPPADWGCTAAAPLVVPCVAAATRPDRPKCLKPRSSRATRRLCLAPRPKSHWRPATRRKFGPARPPGTSRSSQERGTHPSSSTSMAGNDKSSWQKLNGAQFEIPRHTNF